MRPGGIGIVFVVARTITGGRAPIEGMLTVQVAGGTSSRVPWLITFRPRNDELLTGLQLSTLSFKPSDSTPAVLSFQAGRVAEGGQVEPVSLLVLELRRANGQHLGRLAVLRDLLPGLYSFGLTGRDAKGETLERGRYRVRLTAYPTAHGPPSTAAATFSIR